MNGMLKMFLIGCALILVGFFIIGVATKTMPDKWTCGRCGVTYVNQTFAHLDESFNLSALCPICWNDLPPKERVRYYVLAFRQGPDAGDLNAEQRLRNEILGWAEPVAGETGSGTAFVFYGPNDLKPGFWAQKEIEQAKKEGWDNPFWGLYGTEPENDP